MLRVTSSDPLEGDRKFLYSARLEIALEVLNKLITAGEPILDAQLVDGMKAVTLPLEAFDGQPLRGPLQQLQAEWEAILQ